MFYYVGTEPWPEGCQTIHRPTPLLLAGSDIKLISTATSVDFNAVPCAQGLDTAYLCLWGFKHACEALANRVEIQTCASECCEVCFMLLNVW